MISFLDKTDSKSKENKSITIKKVNASKSDIKKNKIIKQLYNIILPLLAAAIIYLVFDHNSRIARTEVEINYQKESINNNSQKLESHNIQLNDLKNKQTLLEYKVDKNK